MREEARDARKFIHGGEPDEQRRLGGCQARVYDVRPRLLSGHSTTHMNENASAYGERVSFTRLRVCTLDVERRMAASAFRAVSPSCIGVYRLFPRNVGHEFPAS